jgi:thioredoxin-like negative regulator of GroEL
VSGQLLITMGKHSVFAALLIIILTSCGRSQPPALVDGILQLNDKNIDHTIAASSGALLVHFSSYDPNCGYCVRSNEEIRELLRDYANAPQLARITWEPWHKGAEISPTVYEQYWIRGLPLFVLYDNGKEVWRGTGHSEAIYAELAEWLDDCCQ